MTTRTLHANPSFYPSPGEFVARRFLGTKPPLFGYAPFGGGSRRCLGAAFAMYEMKLVLATLLTTFDLALVDRNAVPMRRNITMGPRGGSPDVRPRAAGSGRGAGSARLSRLRAPGPRCESVKKYIGWPRSCSFREGAALSILAG